jgi:phospholipase B1
MLVSLIIKNNNKKIIFILKKAKSGETSHGMPDQASLLLERLRSNGDCDLINDWKIITLFVGVSFFYLKLCLRKIISIKGNDLCLFCQDYDAYTPDSFTQHIQTTLDFFHANIPRALVNLVLVLDVRDVEKLNAGGPVCSLLHSNTCPCAAFPPTPEDRVILNEWIPLYQSKLVDLVNTGRYDTKPDFTVVVQPFMAHTPLPLQPNGEPDYNYFAPDCFHFSGLFILFKLKNRFEYCFI